MEIMEIKENIKKVQAESERLRRAVRERTTGYIVAALGFVVGLAWNEAVKGLIEYLFPLAKDTLFAKFVYAIILTVVLAVFTVYVIRGAETQSPK